MVIFNMLIAMSHSTTNLSRRDLLKFAVATAGLTALGPMANVAQAMADNRKFVVLVNLDGGNDSLNTLIPLNIGAYYDRRPSISVDTPLELPPRLLLSDGEITVFDPQMDVYWQVA